MGRDRGADLDEAVGRVAVQEIGYGEEFATGDILGDLVGANLHGEEGNGMVLCAVWIGVILLLIELRVVYFVEALVVGELIEDVAEGDAEGEEVPELGDGVCRLVIIGRGEGKVEGEAAKPHQPGAEG
jgi:hypothetical protein